MIPQFTARDLIADTKSARLLSIIIFGIALFAVLSRNDFFSTRTHITHDTITYTNRPGLSAGYNLSNFSSRLRPPGFSLFMTMVTFGKIPNDQIIAHMFCGDSVFVKGENCNAAVPVINDIVVRMPPLIYGYTKDTAAEFRTIVVASKVIFILSVFFLFWGLTFYVPPLLAAIAVALVSSQVPISLVAGIIQTEMLFPALLFAYVSGLMLYLVSFKARWLMLASVIAVICFFVRPVFLYLIIIHSVFILWVAVVRRTRWTLAAVGIIGAPVIWLFMFSPVTFFSVANFQSAALRTAILSDGKTVECVEPHNSKIILAAYLRSIYTPSIEKMDHLNRYYAFALANSYRLNESNHPIYAEPEMRSFDRPISSTDINRMLQAAAKCNFWRNIDYMVLATKGMLGLSPIQAPQIERHFFKYSFALYLALVAIGLSIFLLIQQRRYTFAFVVGFCTAIYFSMILIVALKQGGESRYIDVVEPVFVLAVAMACSALCQELLRRTPASYSGQSTSDDPIA